jgi:hypothetical protein
MKVALVLFVLFCGTAFASQKPQPVYQDAILISFYNVSTGSSCASTGTVNGKADNNGNVSGSTEGNTNCSTNESRRYKVKVGDNLFVLKRAFGKGQTAGAVASMGWSLLFVKDSVLTNLLPGTPIKVRSDGTGFYVRVGKKESRFEIVSAE